jgi:ligand-binding SRPBCC domain-containing protein
VTVDFELVSNIAAPPERCFDLSLDIDLRVGSMTDSGERAVEGVTSGRIGLDQTVTWHAKHFGISWRMTSKITALDRPSRFVDEQVKGPFSRFHHEHIFESTSSGTRMVDRITFDAPAGPIGYLVERAILARHLRGLIEARNEFLRSQAEAGR